MDRVLLLQIATNQKQAKMDKEHILCNRPNLKNVSDALF